MKMFRDCSVYLTPEVYWMAKVLTKELCKNCEKPITEDEFISGELRDRFTRQYPGLVGGFEDHCALRQKHRKEHEELEEKSLE